MTIYEFGDVLLVSFPQSGTAARKQRPGLAVLDVGDADVVIAPITSRSRSFAGDVPVTDLNGTGLVLASCVRLAKVATLLKSEVVRNLGRLSGVDQSAVRSCWQKLYADFAAPQPPKAQP